MFRSDSHFLIGHAHLSAGKPCQDYAVSGNTSSIAYAIVSDGCSTGRRTDVGARIIALATEAAIQQSPATIASIRHGQQAAMAGIMGLRVATREDMLATALYAYVAADGGFIHLQGDGVVAMQYLGGRVDMVRYEWRHNTPLYLAYALDDYVGFKAAHQDCTTAALSAERWQYQPSGGLQPQEEKSFSVDVGIHGISIDIPPTSLADLEYVAVFTDGVSQIDRLDWKHAALELLAFKSTAGEFAKRRLNRMVKDAQKTGKGPMDDIAYAVIHIQRDTP